MKNYEKYADAIREYKGDSFCIDFVKPNILKSEDCDVDCTRCRMLQVLWLLENYEEPKEPEVDWSKVEVDTPILVRDGEDEEWIKQHFAECDGKVVCAWRAGKTSWTEDCVMGWKFAKLAETEGAE